MYKVATVNGIPVYSDKRGAISINNSRITFADGSSCDVSTKVVINRGPGGIQIGEDGGQTQTKVTKGPMRFSTSRLHALNLNGNLSVEVWNQPGMGVTITGPKDAVEAIVAKPDGSTLLIEGKDAECSSGGVSVSGVSIRSGRGSSGVSVHGVVGGMIITGGNVTVIGGAGPSGDDAVAVLVKLPQGAGIALDGTNGNVTIGDVEGELNINAKGGGEVRSGRMSGATVAIQGSTDVHISEVNGPLTAQIMGSGDIRVKSGAVTALNVQIMGSGDFRFGGVADTATLSVMGSGDISVAKVKTKPVKRCLGSGDINVG